MEIYTDIDVDFFLQMKPFQGPRHDDVYGGPVTLNHDFLELELQVVLLVVSNNLKHSPRNRVHLA